MHLIRIEFHMMLHFESTLEGLDLGNVLVPRRQHYDWNSNMGRIFAVHQRRMNLSGCFKWCLCT